MFFSFILFLVGMVSFTIYAVTKKEPADEYEYIDEFRFYERKYF